MGQEYGLQSGNVSLLLQVPAGFRQTGRQARQALCSCAVRAEIRRQAARPTTHRPEERVFGKDTIRIICPEFTELSADLNALNMYVIDC